MNEHDVGTVGFNCEVVHHAMLCSIMTGDVRPRMMSNKSKGFPISKNRAKLLTVFECHMRNEPSSLILGQLHGCQFKLYMHTFKFCYRHHRTNNKVPSSC